MLLLINECFFLLETKIQLLNMWRFVKRKGPKFMGMQCASSVVGYLDAEKYKIIVGVGWRNFRIMSDLVIILGICIWRLEDLFFLTFY